MVTIVVAQMRNNLPLEPCLFSVFILKTLDALPTIGNTFQINCRFFSGDVAFSGNFKQFKVEV